MRRTVCAALALAFVAAAAVAQSGRPVDLVYLGRTAASGYDQTHDLLFESFERPAPRYPVDEYRIVYETRDTDGTPVEAHASLFVPVMDVARRAPILAFGSGTTGLGDQCAPSLERPFDVRWGYYRANMEAYADQGIITIFPDYIGFNDPDRPQRYFSAAAEGHLMLDAIRAVLEIFEFSRGVIASSVEPSGAAVTAGYSQGGHAALAAADMRQAYAPDVDLRGAIGFGTTNSVETLMREAAYYTPNILYTYREIYGSVIDLGELIQEQWLPTLERDVLSMCVEEFQFHFPFDGRDLYTERFYRALHADELDDEFPALKEILDANETGLTGHGLPVQIIQGNQDIIVTNDAQRRYVAELRASGSDVDYRELEGVRHRHTRPAGFAASVAFIRRVTSEL